MNDDNDDLSPVDKFMVGFLVVVLGFAIFFILEG
jgi:hypothetical protein